VCVTVARYTTMPSAERQYQWACCKVVLFTMGFCAHSPNAAVTYRVVYKDCLAMSLLVVHVYQSGVYVYNVLPASTFVVTASVCRPLSVVDVIGPVWVQSYADAIHCCLLQVLLPLAMLV